MSLAGWVLRAAARSGFNLAQPALSLLAGPWLWRGLMDQAAAHSGPGRRAGGLAALSFDVDFRADVAALDGLLNQLARLGLKASFACVGYWIEKFPAEHASLVQAGQEIVNHTQSHPDNEEIDLRRHFHQLSGRDLRYQIEAAHRIIEEELGVRPRGFRAPHFGHQHTEEVYPILAELGYTYSSSTLAWRPPSWGWPRPAAGGRLWEMPVSVCPRHPFSSFDTWHFIRKRPSRHRPGDFLRYLEKLIEAAVRDGLPLALYFDPRDFSGSGACRQALELLAESGLETVPFGQWAERLGRPGR